MRLEYNIGRMADEFWRQQLFYGELVDVERYRSKH